MTRIVYAFYSGGGLQGGHKMILRHVETLRDLGFDAVAYTGAVNKLPWWFEHRAPILVEEVLYPERDVLVIPDDSVETLKQLSARPYRMFVLVQNQFNFAAETLDILDLYPPERLPGFIAVSPGVEALLRRIYPAAAVERINAFADERVFRPGEGREHAIGLIARKRPVESMAIRRLFLKLHPEHADLRWRWIRDATEQEVAASFGGSTLFLSLSRLESVGMTPLEAMAAGCVCAGFTGIGGRDYATAENGFWVDEDDCVAAADAVARAADLVRADGPALQHFVETGHETARRWSYAAFREQLEETWMRLAPGARLKNGPLD